MRKIKNIIFYNSTKNKICTEQSCIFYNDGTVEKVSKNNGIELIIEFAKENNLKNMTEVNQCKNIRILTEETFLKEYMNILKDSYEEVKEENKTEEEENVPIQNQYFQKKQQKKNKSILKRIWFTAKLALGLTVAFITGKEVKFVYDIFNSSSSYDNENKNKQLIENNNISKLLNHVTTNDDKRRFLTKAWTYLNEYNSDFSSQYLSKKTDTKLAHSWEEVVIQELLYNNYKKAELTNIFDSYTCDYDLMYKAYQNAIKQETKAHIVQTSSFNKQSLINSNKGKDFYMKYESLMISFNIQDSSERKEKVAQQFYNLLKEDFDVSNIKNNESYKLAILPIINAMNKECKNLNRDYILSDKELKDINKKCLNKIVKEKLEKYIKTINTYSIVTQSVNNDCYSVTYENIKEAAINKLLENNYYGIQNNQRNISDHKEYKKRINWNYNNINIINEPIPSNNKEKSEKKETKTKKFEEEILLDDNNRNTNSDETSTPEENNSDTNTPEPTNNDNKNNIINNPEPESYNEDESIDYNESLSEYNSITNIESIEDKVNRIINQLDTTTNYPSNSKVYIKR